MSKQKPTEIFMPPNVLKVKMGGNADIPPDDSLLARAESALSHVRSDVAATLDERIAMLIEMRKSFRADPHAAGIQMILMSTAEDLRQSAIDGDFLLAGRITESLINLLNNKDQVSDRLLADLVDAHVAAIRTAIRECIRNPNDTRARLTADALEHRVEAAISAAK